MSSKTISRAALGRAAGLGALYDIRTDSFLNDTHFASKLDGDMIDSMELEETAIELVMSDRLEDKCKKLDVETELQVSVMCGMVTLNGSGEYLAEEKNNNRSKSMSLIYKLSSVNEEIMVRKNKKKFDIGALSEQAGLATHVVVGIDWGANCCITCQYNMTKDQDATEVEGAVKAEINKLKGHIGDKTIGSVLSEQKESEASRDFTFQCHADVSAPEKDLPVTFEGAVEFVKALPSLIKQTNSGKGVPLTYNLMPLETFVKMCSPNIKFDVIYNEIQESTAKECAEVLERLTKKRQALFAIKCEMHDNEAFVPDEAIHDINGVFGKVSQQVTDFKSQLHELVKSVRSGAEDTSVLFKMLKEQEDELMSIAQYTDRFQSHLVKIKLIKQWQSKGIIYIGKGEQNFQERHNKTVVLYRINHDSHRSERCKLEGFFLRKLATHSKGDDTKYVVVDQELNPRYFPKNINKDTVQEVRDGKVVCRDLYAKEGQYFEMFLVKIGKASHIPKRPKNRTYIRLTCPKALSGKNQCSDGIVHWKCAKCLEMIEYGIDSCRFYCKCGESNQENALFRCNNETHVNFLPYPKDILKDKLLNHRVTKEINLLILGETGVGKSTWINSFQHYLLFADLQQAMKSPKMHALIPARITYTGDNGEKTIEIGQASDTESLDVGKSCTKEPRSYVFDVGEERIRLIDTPGIGDTGGVQQDKENLDKILSYLTLFEEIHAVCILLKPNLSRLTPSLKFCIQELLIQLHASAKDNVVFCFTSARGTHYMPGNTTSLLRTLFTEMKLNIKVKQCNCFCFENEAFQFLALMKNGVKYDKDIINTFSSSWDLSVKETHRLFQYILDELKPHDLRKTVGMNEIRRRIVAMGKPLAEVAKTISQSVDKIEKVRTTIRQATGDMKELEKHLNFSGYDIEHENLVYPMTVCTHEKCVKLVQVGTENVQNAVFDTICDSHCILPGIPTETTNNWRLRFCGSMNKLTGRCSKCGHSYKCHMRLTYKMNIVSKTYLSKEVQQNISKKGSLKEQKEEAIKVLDAETKELITEEKEIINTAAIFGSFLKANALVLYNDAVQDYLEMSIEQEEKRGEGIQNKAHLQQMKTMREEYGLQKEVLDKAVKAGKGGNKLSLDDVMKLQEKLFALKHFGNTLKKLFDAISIRQLDKDQSVGETMAQTEAFVSGKSKETSRKVLPKGMTVFKR